MKPLWAVAGVALIGTAGVAGALVVTSTGGDEEVVQQIETGTPTDMGCGSEIGCETQTPAPGCVLNVTGDGRLQCLALDSFATELELFEKCNPIRFRDRLACLPPGATVTHVLAETAVAEASPSWPKYDEVIRRGDSIIRVEVGGTVMEYNVAPEDAADFRAMEALFQP